MRDVAVQVDAARCERRVGDIMSPYLYMEARIEFGS